MYYKGDPAGPGEPLVDFLRSPQNQLLNEANRTRMYDWLEGVTDPEFPLRQYAAGISYVDHEVGRVVAGLKAAGLYDQAVPDASRYAFSPPSRQYRCCRRRSAVGP